MDLIENIKDLRKQKNVIDKDLARKENLAFQDNRELLKELGIDVYENDYDGISRAQDITNKVVENSDDYYVTLTDLLKILHDNNIKGE